MHGKFKTQLLAFKFLVQLPTPIILDQYNLCSGILGTVHYCWLGGGGFDNFIANPGIHV